MYQRIYHKKSYPVLTIVLPIILIAVLAFVDQVVKYFVILHLKNIDKPIIGDLLHFYYIENTGAAFSTLQGKRWLLIAFTTIMVIVCFIILLTNKVQTLLGKTALVLIAAGGIGNLIDRIFRGYVIDFIYVKAIHFAIFNVADSFVVIGACLLCIFLITKRENPPHMGRYR